MIRTTAAVLVVAAGALVPLAAAAKPDYTATCASTHDMTLTWTGGTDATATAVLEWADSSDEVVSLTLPHGGVRTNTWNNLGTNSGLLVGAEVTFHRNNGVSQTLRVTCSQ